LNPNNGRGGFTASGNDYPTRDAVNAHEPQVGGVIARFRLQRLLRRWPSTGVSALYVFVNSFGTIALLAVLAGVTGSPFVFPSLGPTAYIFFFSPMSKAASPRDTILGHAIAILCGYFAFKLGGSHIFTPNAHAAGLEWAHVFAGAISLSLTGAIMVLFHINHPPAGATTMIVSLGILSTPRALVIIEIAVILLTVQAFCINRFAGVRYPVWRANDRGLRG
jgi:CBS-domain-containing membrane protein